MCIITDALCPACGARSTPRSRVNRCFASVCVPEKTTRYLHPRETADFFCTTAGCAFDDPEQLRKYVVGYYGVDVEQFKRDLMPLFVKKLGEKVAKK